MAGRAGEEAQDQLAQELRDPTSEATGAFTEWLLEGAAEVNANEQNNTAAEQE